MCLQSSSFQGDYFPLLLKASFCRKIPCCLRCWSPDCLLAATCTMLFWTFFFYSLKQQNFAGNFPVASRLFGQPRPTQLLVVRWWKEISSPPAYLCLHIRKVPFLLWKVFPVDVIKDREHFSTATELSKHQIAHPAQTSHLLHSLIFNLRGKHLTDFYCTFPSSYFMGACHMAAFFQLSALQASSTPHPQLNNIYLI